MAWVIGQNWAGVGRRRGWMRRFAPHRPLCHRMWPRFHPLLWRMDVLCFGNSAFVVTFIFLQPLHNKELVQPGGSASGCRVYWQDMG